MGRETAGRKLEPRLAAVLAYLLGIVTGIILLRVERESRFVRFHALQSILYSAVVIVVLASVTLAGLSPLNEWIMLAFVTVWFYVMFRAARGELYELPLVGWWAERNA